MIIPNIHKAIRSAQAVSPSTAKPANNIVLSAINMELLFRNIGPGIAYDVQVIGIYNYKGNKSEESSNTPFVGPQGTLIQNIDLLYNNQIESDITVLIYYKDIYNNLYNQIMNANSKNQSLTDIQFSLPELIQDNCSSSTSEFLRSTQGVNTYIKNLY